MQAELVINTCPSPMLFRNVCCKKPINAIFKKDLEKYSRINCSRIEKVVQEIFKNLLDFENMFSNNVCGFRKYSRISKNVHELKNQKLKKCSQKI